MAVEALRNEGANVKGMAAIFTYGFDVSKDSFKKANIDVYTLSDYNTLLAKAVEKQYVTEKEMESLIEWSKSPSTWNQE